MRRETDPLVSRGIVSLDDSSLKPEEMIRRTVQWIINIKRIQDSRLANVEAKLKANDDKG